MNSICTLAHGTYPGDICACVASLGLPVPEHSWYEPRPGGGLDESGDIIPALRPEKLHPLLRSGPLDPPEGVCIDEARLFWSWGSLHLVDDGVDATRWSFWAQATGTEDDPSKADVETAIKATAAEAESGLVVDAIEVLTLSRRGCQRFFGSEDEFDIGGLRLRLLRERSGGGMVGWTIVGSTRESA